MATATTARAPYPTPADSRFDRRLSQILDYATAVFAEKGYEGASMRDLSRRSGISLAGLYYYFDSKEKLLYFIQKHTFATILDRLGEQLAGSSNPEERLRIFVRNHVEYAVRKPKAMTVLSHEDDALRNGYGAELKAIKREYYQLCMGLVEDFARAENLHLSDSKAKAAPGLTPRTAVMGLFGMMNWLYTWYNPRIDPNAARLADDLSDLFVEGLRGARDKRKVPAGNATRNGKHSSKTARS